MLQNFETISTHANSRVHNNEIHEMLNDNCFVNVDDPNEDVIPFCQVGMTQDAESITQKIVIRSYIQAVNNLQNFLI